MDLPPFRVWSEGDVTIVGMTGSLGQPLANANGLKGLVADGAKKLVVDFTGVQFVGSYVLGHLIVAYRLLREAGGGLRICCPEHEVREVFRITRLDVIMPFFSTKDEAIASFSNGV